MTARERLERRLERLLQRKHCVLMGRGATGIYSVLQLLDSSRRKIILPATLCPSPATVAKLAGYNILFCDIRSDDFTIDPKHLRTLLEAHDDVAAVLAVHLYGHPADMDAVTALAHEHGVLVIEDAAQSLGASWQGRPCGSMGDVSVISFGHTKIIDVGWGGAVLTDDDSMADALRDAASRLPPCPANIQRRFEDYRAGYYALQENLNSYQNASSFQEFLLSFGDIYIFNFDEAWASPIDQALDALDDVVGRRRLNAAALANVLDHPLITKPCPSTGAVPWRYSILLDGRLQGPVTDGLRQAGFDASNWYPSLFPWYGDPALQGADDLPMADRVERQVLNLWVEPGRDESYQRRLGEAVCSIIDNLKRHQGNRP